MRRAVVIGAGMGGLVAARLLQLRGMEVTVLERHVRPGGFLHRFFREGRAYDTGFHYCGGIEAGQPLGQILRHLGVFEQLRFVALDPNGFDRLWFPDLVIDMPRGWEAWRERLVERFPHERDGIDGALTALREAVEPYALYRMRADLDLLAVLGVEGAGLLDTLRRHIRDPRLLAVLCAHAPLYGVPPHLASLGLHALILDHLLQGAWTLEGGGDRLALRLTRVLRADGGRVLLGHEAIAIRCEGRRAVAVETRDGGSFPADLVISDLHPRLTLALLPDHAVRPIQRRRTTETAVGIGHLGLYLALKTGPTLLGRRNLYRFPSWDLRRAFRPVTAGRCGLYFACSPTEQIGMTDRSVALLVTPMRWSDVAPWAQSRPGERPPGYLRLKEAVTNRVLETFLADHPILRDRIERVEASTPLSTYHFTRSPRGAMYGHFHSREQMGRSRPAPRTRIQNLAMVGQGVFSPGILGVSLSAYYAVGRFFGLEGLLRELKEA